MLNYFAVGLGGALGAILRFFIYNRFGTAGHASLFALPTLVVNIIGSLCIGIAWYYLVEKAMLPPVWKNLVITGFLGALTTFSTFSIDTLRLIQSEQYTIALGYMVANVVLCVTGVFVSYQLIKMI